MDEKSSELSASVMQRVNEKAADVRQYTDDQNSTIRSVCVIKAGDARRAICP